MDCQKDKKATELRCLEAARCAGAPIPNGEVELREEPDFALATETGIVGIEVTELLPPVSGDAFSSPLAQKDFQDRVVDLAEREYNRTPGALPTKVLVYFWNPEGKIYDKRAMALSLVAFVKAHRDEAVPIKTFSWRPDLPEGFAVIQIIAESRPWTSGESIHMTVDGIYQQLAERIRAKNQRLPEYRANLPGSQIWLLIYSGVSVSRGVHMPHGIGDLRFPFGFDRVLFYSALSNKVEDIYGSENRPTFR
jgi:hypothetical protein